MERHFAVIKQGDFKPEKGNRERESALKCALGLGVHEMV